MVDAFNADTLVKLASQDVQRNRIADAEAKCLRVLGINKQHPGALTVLGMVLHLQGRHADAIRVFNALTVFEPENPEHWGNLGSEFRSVKRYDEALSAYGQALRSGRASASLLYNIGALHMDRGDFDTAYRVLGQSVELAPTNALLRSVFAQCCYDTVRTDEGLAVLENWQQLDKLTPDVIAQIAYLLTIMGEARRAEPALQKLLTNPQLSTQALLTLARVLERVNRLPEAHAALKQLKAASTATSTDPDVLLAEALLAEREGNAEDAREFLSRALKVHSDFLRRHQWLFPLARSLDVLGRSEEAWSTLQDAHQSQLSFIEVTSGKTRTEQPAAMLLAEHHCEVEDISLWDDTTAPDIENSPIFIVAFPRSGTTLLEQTLDAHPLLQSMDEQPYLNKALDEVMECGIRYPTELAKLTRAQLENIRARYWERVRRKIGLQPGKRLVDKNPLNLMRLPLIRRLFPAAPVILAIRHPCDTLLSCFFQHFRAPDLAIMCRDLPTLAENYRRAFDFWYAQLPLLKPSVREVRYETFVAGFDTEVHSLSEFLQLPWDDAMLTPAEHARAKGFISTPSYAQVIQPISNKSVGRWKRYETHFRDVLPVLMPYIERWGYDV